MSSYDDMLNGLLGKMKMDTVYEQDHSKQVLLSFV